MSNNLKYVYPPITMEEYYTIYPHGHTIFESYIDVVNEVNHGIDVINNAVQHFNTELPNTVSVEVELQNQELNDRLDTIITTPIDSVSVQEVIDARQGKSTLKHNFEEVKSQLADKASFDSTESAHARIDTLVIASGNANAEVDDAKVSTVKNKTFPAIRQRFEELEVSLHSNVRNLVTNGDFSNGSTGWSLSNSVIVEELGRLKIHALGQYGGADTVINTVPGRKYYISCSVDGLISLSRFFIVGLADTITSVTKVGGERLTLIFTATNTTHKLRFYDNSTSGWIPFYVDKVIALDLTLIFGAGEEPNINKIDNWLSYYDYWFDDVIKTKDTNKALLEKIFFDNTPDISNIFQHVDSSVFNQSTGLKRWRALLAKVQASNHIFNLNIIGTSIAAGGVSSDYTTKSWVSLLRQKLTEKYGDVGFGAISTHFPTTVGPLLWNFVGTWSTQVLFGIMGDARLSTTLGSTATVTFEGTGFKILVYSNSSGGKFLASVDGAPAVEYNAYSATAIPCREFVISGLSDGTHTLVITQNEAGKNTLLLGGYPTKGVKGVRVNNLSKSGGSTTNVTWNANVLTSMVDYWTPGLTIIELFTNDYMSQTPLNTFKSNIQTLITRAKLYGDVILLPNGIRTENSTITQVQYINVLKELAIENDIVLCNTFTRWGESYTEANGVFGFLHDTVHPNDVGHQDIVNFILKVLIEH